MKQRSADWFSARLGNLTGSRMAIALAFKKDGKETNERADYKIQLVAERMTGEIVPHFVTHAMQHGIETEPRGLEAYEIATGNMVRSAPFVPHPSIEYFGASPDGLIDRDGLIELKCPTSATHIGWMLAGVVPEEHKPQMIAQLMCTGRTWCDFVSFDPRMPESRQLFVRRFMPTAEEYERVEQGAIQFLAEVEALFDRVTTAEVIA